MNVRALVSEDGGKTFYTMKEQNKHSDNHALVFKLVIQTIYYLVVMVVYMNLLTIQIIGNL